MNKTNLLLAVGGVFVAVVLAVLLDPKIPTPPLSATPQGGTFSTAKTNAVVVNLAAPGANATSSTILNSTGNDLYITAIRGGCESVGTSFTAYSGTGLTSGGLTLKVATSSTAAPSSNANTNLVGGGAIVLATTTPNFVFATTTAPLSSVVNIWQAGSYLNFFTNATNTALCTFGVDVVSS